MAYRHWEYHWFEAWQVPDEQHVAPVHPEPPHWPHMAAHYKKGQSVVFSPPL